MKYVALPNILLFQFLFALISPVMDLVLVLGIAADLRDNYTRFLTGAFRQNWNIMTYWAVFQTLELAVGAVAFALDRQEDAGLVVAAQGAAEVLLPQLIYRWR